MIRKQLVKCRIKFNPVYPNFKKNESGQKDAIWNKSNVKEPKQKSMIPKLTKNDRRKQK